MVKVGEENNDSRKITKGRMKKEEIEKWLMEGVDNEHAGVIGFLTELHNPFYYTMLISHVNNDEYLYPMPNNWNWGCSLWDPCENEWESDIDGMPFLTTTHLLYPGQAWDW